MPGGAERSEQDVAVTREELLLQLLLGVGSVYCMEHMDRVSAWTGEGGGVLLGLKTREG